jgi:hypothetical protein
MEDQVVLQRSANQAEKLLNELRQACKKIAPVWPLENFVAVNPFLGLADQKFESTAQYLATVGGVQMTMPVSFYLEKIKEGTITRADIKSALQTTSNQIDVDSFLRQMEQLAKNEPQPVALPTLIDVATQVTQKDWNRFVTARITGWAAAYFDRGQAQWTSADQAAGLFAAWKSEAERDLTPEISGLPKFRQAVKALPNDALQATEAALKILDIADNERAVYLHRLLLRMGGWSAYVAQLDWQSELYGGKDGKLIEFLSVLLCWEACLFTSLDGPKLRVKWIGAKRALARANASTHYSEELTQKLILQHAFDMATQRAIIRKFRFNEAIDRKKSTKPKAQAIFCIDVRSEVYRRNLELVDSEIETLGFAGFFAFPIKYVPLAHAEGESQCPVLIKTGPTILEEIEGAEANQKAQANRVMKYRLSQLWKSFRSSAITCFSFVSPLGLSYLPKIFTDSFGLTRPVPHPDQVGISKHDFKNKTVSLKSEVHDRETVGIPLDQQVQMAKNALTAMSLTDNFAPFVLIVGHGSTSVNNPHATGLDCGACGGHTGEANARVAAAVLNEKAVRERLQSEENISIPDDTLFLACLHDTTTDELHIYGEHIVPTVRTGELHALKLSLAQAGQAARTERAMRMWVDETDDEAVMARSKDWSQVRPEWGLAGCSAFVVAPRERTKQVDLGGRAFLHSYAWKKDRGFTTLELIMTAPMVVTSWINLQYYASTVDNKNYGAGNKTLHNVTAGLGVLEGYSGDLRVGLPLQSVHDGAKFQHEPVKLNVIIEAPIEAMNEILKKHQSVRNLCDNGWIHLLAMDATGQVSKRYIGNLMWENVVE